MKTGMMALCWPNGGQRLAFSPIRRLARSNYSSAETATVTPPMTSVTPAVTSDMFILLCCDTESCVRTHQQQTKEQLRILTQRFRGKSYNILVDVIAVSCRETETLKLFQT